MRLLVTGGAGFIGSNFVHIAVKQGHDVVVLDSMTEVSNPDNLNGLANLRLVGGDIRDKKLVSSLLDVDAVVNFAAESHVDNSIRDDTDKFIASNVSGVHALLSTIKESKRDIRFIQIGTDEVYGSVTGFPDEKTVLNPSNLYAATKAAADMIALSYYYTHSIDVMVTRSTNNYGPRQYPEKLIPLFIKRAYNWDKLPLYDDGSQIRDWLHVYDNCEAILLLLDRGQAGEIYNIGANNNPEITNLQVVKYLIHAIERYESLIQLSPGARPGHDQRYAVNTEKISNLGWKPKIPFWGGLEDTVKWYLHDL
jgi:dTDP-glucose 4,6-dehydratase